MGIMRSSDDGKGYRRSWVRRKNLLTLVWVGERERGWEKNSDKRKKKEKKENREKEREKVEQR